MHAPGDRWWQGFDAVIVDAVGAHARILDVGCGDGSLVEHLRELGLDAVGVDPRAPARPHLIQSRVEDLGAMERFDAVCAVMSLHHADLESTLARVLELLRPDGRLVVHELAWEAYDERATAWLDRHDRSGRDNSVAAWMREHADLHTSASVHAALAERFTLVSEQPRPHLARMLGLVPLEPAEQALIDDGGLPALGRCWLGRR
jgi:SAM-dependent methyltransferase